jgi:tetratricopeptide (TPR) repeat protein
MNTASFSGRLIAILLTTSTLAAPAVWSREEAPVAQAVDTDNGRQELAYQRAIEQLESSEGAYGEHLSESLLSLARTLQAQERHDEAIALFRRSVHLTRINEGLYCPQQIPLLLGEIASHKAVQNYADVDDLQNYLYRVQLRSLESGDALASAIMDQAKWQYDAYQLGLGQEGYTRLMEMWNLYRMALKDVIQRQGEKSPELLPPLRGMLQAQYLISSYQVVEPMPVFANEEPRVDEALLRFKKYQAQSYQQGTAIIESITDIEQQHTTPDTPSLAQALVMLGDWRLWNGRTDAAWEAYREAATELARSGDAQAETQQLFGEPVALPDFEELNPLPPVVQGGRAAVTLAFGVSEYGRVQDIERLDNNEEEDRQASRLMRQLRKTPFRPRFEAGQPVETEKLVKAFDLQ